MKKRKNGYFYILPILLMTVFFWYIPILISVTFSFTDYNILRPLRFTGLENYIQLGKDSYFLKSLENTFIFVALVTPVQTVLAFAAALWIVEGKQGPLRSFVRSAMFIPSIVSVTVIGIVSRVLLNNPDSPINAVAGLFGGSASGLLGSEKTSLLTLMTIEVLINTGYYMIFFLNSLLEMPESYYEAAVVDGAGKFRVYRHITIPLMSPVIIMVVFLGAIQGFRTFDLVYTTTGGGPGQSSLTAMVYLYMENFKFSKVGYAMAMGNVLILIVFALTFMQRRFLKNKDSKLY